MGCMGEDMVHTLLACTKTPQALYPRTHVQAGGTVVLYCSCYSCIAFVHRDVSWTLVTGTWGYRASQ